MTGSRFLEGNREADLKPNPFSLLLLFSFFLFPLLLNPRRYSTFDCCLLELLLNNIYLIYIAFESGAMLEDWSSASIIPLY